MSEYIKHANKKLILRIIKELEKNRIKSYYTDNKEQALKQAIDLVKENSSVTFFGSESVKEIGLKEYFYKNIDKYKVIDPAEKGITREESLKRRWLGLQCDYAFTSTNAITIKGELVNVDGFGNRVAGMIYGPQKVIFIVGANKIVNNIQEGFDRVRLKASPPNTKKLNKNTPCKETGICMDCNSEDRICNFYTVIKRAQYNDRIFVIFVNESLGF